MTRSGVVRVGHWITAAGFLALLLSGMEIVISHPRFYWGETGNVLTPALFQLPIPSSRALVQTGYGYVMPDQNGWSRALHFQSAWVVVVTGIIYAAWGLARRHFSRDFSTVYNSLQKLTYLFVIFVVFPMAIWTGLAMSPGFTSAVPGAVELLGGRQSARTLHFFISLFLVVFLGVHVVMICVSGFRERMRGMITG